jgi:hypothetical protein
VALIACPKARRRRAISCSLPTSEGSESHRARQPFKDVCKHLLLEKRVTPKATPRTLQDLARRAAVDGLVQRSICGHLTEEMTERYSSVAQVEVEAALGKVVSLAGHRDLLGGASSGPEVVGAWGVVGNEVSTSEASEGRDLQPAAFA